MTDLLESYEPLSEIIIGSKTEKLVWSITKILGLKSPQSVDVERKFGYFCDNCFGLTAFYLNPKSDRTLLSQAHVHQINNVIIFGFPESKFV